MNAKTESGYRVVHLTSVHPPGDPRIFHKQCRSLVQAGFDVTLIAPAEADALSEGIRIKAVQKDKGRFRRVVLTAWRVWREAMKHGAHICHFHDPELIPAALLLRLAGRAVIYDVHEDYVTSITQKPYLPGIVTRFLAVVFGGLERVASRFFNVILAERYYQDRFPRGLQVLNHPRLEDLPVVNESAAPSPEPRCLYTGNMGHDRGSREHARLLGRNAGLKLTMIGRCPLEIAKEIRRDAGTNVSGLELVGEGEYVAYAAILAAYEMGGWTAGLALFPATDHYRRKELTKFYEYMAAGIPVLCSDFPVWRNVIEREKCGLCVDPSDAAAVDAALRWLVQHPQEARQMGERGRRAVTERYHWDLQARKLVGLYRRLMD